MIPPTVGPIVGFTTSQHARIFVRGELDKNNAVFAGIRHRKAGDSQWSVGVFSRLSPEFDMSDTLVLNTLHSDTRYTRLAGSPPQTPGTRLKPSSRSRFNGLPRYTASRPTQLHATVLADMSLALAATSGSRQASLLLRT